MVAYLLTLLSGVVIFTLAILHLNQNLLNYLDFIAFILVAGGTFAVALSILPWEYRNEVFYSIKVLFRGENRRYKKVLKNCFEATRDPNLVTTFKEKDLSTKILRDGFDLMSLGFNEEKVEFILREKIYQNIKRLAKISNSIKSIAKYPPAFGLMGTVLGLINVMRGITQGVDVKQTGLEMAIALLATMYGLVTANLIVQPAAEILLKKADEEEEYAEIAIQYILLTMKGSSQLEIQEVLNTLVPEEQNYNPFQSLSNEDNDNLKNKAS